MATRPSAFTRNIHLASVNRDRSEPVRKEG
jgi:hypothetical protein